MQKMSEFRVSSFASYIDTGNLRGINYCIKEVDVNEIRIGYYSRRNTHPLHYCASAGKEEICKVLLEAKADPTYRHYENGWSAFDFACYRGHSAVAKMIAYAGASPCVLTSDFMARSIAYPIIQSKKKCVATLVVFYGVLRKRLKESKDTTELMMRMVWEKRFDFYVTDKKK
jgi:hypothetical protein